MGRPYFQCLAFTLLSAVLAFAQQNPPSVLASHPESAPSAKNGDGRIKLDVVVTNKSGKPISGLGIKDFTLLDNNQPSPIVSFRAVDGTSQKAGPVVEVMLVLDAVNLPFSEVASERQEIDRFLHRNTGHLANPVSILLFNNEGVKVLVQPSTDGNAIAAKLDQQEIGLRSIRRSAGMYGAIERLQISIQSIESLAESEAKRPGRKLLIWVGPGWPMFDTQRINVSQQSQQHLFNSIIDLSTNLREGHIALYSVSLGQPGLGTFVYQDFLKGVKSPDKANPPNIALRVVAIQSGGRVLVPNNDLAAQIDNCVQDASAFYTLSFDPQRADKPNEYHDLKLQINKPELTVRTNTGYYNQP